MKELDNLLTSGSNTRTFKIEGIDVEILNVEVQDLREEREEDGLDGLDGLGPVSISLQIKINKQTFFLKEVLEESSKDWKDHDYIIYATKKYGAKKSKELHFLLLAVAQAKFEAYLAS